MRLNARWLLALSLMAALAASPWARADESVAATGADADQGAAADSPDDAEAHRLLGQIDALKRKRATGETRQELNEAMKKKRFVMAELAGKIVVLNAAPEIRKAALGECVSALADLYRVGEDKALDKLVDLARKIKDDPQEDIARIGKSLWFDARAQRVARGNLDDAPDLIKECRGALAKSPNDQRAFDRAFRLAGVFENSDAARPLAVKLYRQIAEVTSNTTDEKIAELSSRIPGIIRRLELVGKRMEIGGTLLDGRPFRPETLRGKVVLVDFWATWCTFCIEELPNVAKNYERYHDKGFEVVGVNLDDQKEAVEEFLQDRHLPWPILFSDDDTARGMNHPMAMTYGVLGIPRAILIDQTGKVVDLNARGDRLTRDLERLLGKVDDKNEEAEKK